MEAVITQRGSERRVFLADDLTGTLEVGAILKQAGQRVQIGLGGLPEAQPDDAVVIDCQARRLSSEAAFARYRQVMDTAGGLPYLKLDSTLRGNVAAAIQAALASYPGRRLVFCPAYPSQGRTVEGGEVLVHGQRLRARSVADQSAEPVVSGLIREVLGSVGVALRHAACGDQLAEMLAASGHGGVITCDARTEQNLCELWQAVDAAPEPIVLAGSAGLLAARYARVAGAGVAAHDLAGRQWIVVCGSMNPATQSQLAGSPWAVFRPPATGAEAAEYLAARGGVVLATPGARWEADVTAWLVAMARDVSERTGAFGLIVFGGDTAASILAARGIRTLAPAGEVLPGVPCSWMTLDNGRTPLITKAGGFGAPDLLRRLISEINKT